MNSIPIVEKYTHTHTHTHFDILHSSGINWYFSVCQHSPLIVILVRKSSKRVTVGNAVKLAWDYLLAGLSYAKPFFFNRAYSLLANSAKWV